MGTLIFLAAFVAWTVTCAFAFKRPLDDEDER